MPRKATFSAEDSGDLGNSINELSRNKGEQMASDPQNADLVDAGSAALNATQADPIEARIEQAMQDGLQAKESPGLAGRFRQIANLTQDSRARIANALFGPETRNALADIVLGGAAGVQAASQPGVSSLGSPLSSAAAGLSAGYGAIQAQDELRKKQKMEAISMMPVEQFSPALVAKYPELRGIPLSIIDKLSPLITKASDLEKQLTLISARDVLNKQNQTISFGRQKDIAALKNEFDQDKARVAFGRNKELLNKRDELILARQKELNDMMTERQVQLANLRNEQARGRVGMGDAKKSSEALKNSEKLISQLEEMYNKITAQGYTGPLTGRAAIMAAKALGGKVAPDVSVFSNLRTGFRPSMKTTVGDSGVLSNQDIEAIDGLLPSAAMDPVAAKKQWAAIREIINNRKRVLLDTYPNAGVDFGPGFQRQQATPDGGVQHLSTEDLMREFKGE